jgi:hypothetical protein
MVGVVAVVVGVVGAKAPVAKLPKQTFRFWMVRVHLIALEAVRVGGGPTTLVLAQCEALVTPRVAVLVFILWPFTCNETGEGTSGRGGRAALIKMRDKVGADGGMGEAALSV